MNCKRSEFAPKPFPVPVPEEFISISKSKPGLPVPPAVTEVDPTLQVVVRNEYVLDRESYPVPEFPLAVPVPAPVLDAEAERPRNLSINQYIPYLIRQTSIAIRKPTPNSYTVSQSAPVREDDAFAFAITFGGTIVACGGSQTKATT